MQKLLLTNPTQLNKYYFHEGMGTNAKFVSMMARAFRNEFAAT